MRGAPIGVFDSGMGGLSVLRALKSALPHESFIYYGDNANAPYGPRPEREIRELTLKAAHALALRGVKALVIACNTASSAAEEAVRRALRIPVVGMEPEIAAASARAGDRRVIVFATQATLSLERYRAAQRKYCPDAVALPAPELVLMVERGVVSGAEPEAYFRRALAPFPARQIGAIVLGCTHFVFLKGALLNVAPGAAVFDGCEAACEKLRSALAAAGLLASDGLGSVQLLSSSPDERVLARMQALLSEG